MACGLILVVAVDRYLRSRTGYIVAAGLLVLVAVARATSVPLWAYQMVAGIVIVALVWFLVRSCGVDLVGFGVALFWLEAVGRGWTLVEQPALSLRVNGVVALVTAAVIGVALIWCYSKKASPGLR
ncbi:MAG: hypothetical protein GY953_31665 [bacterium]|nr:hypothetical protein [bacterium]